VSAAELVQALSGLAGAGRPEVVRDQAGAVTVRVAATGRDASLAGRVRKVLAGKGWEIDELHTDEGRLDEVFRELTIPDTVQEGQS
jgi:ABC-2 type transport system ATP-binding protein